MFILTLIIVCNIPTTLLLLYGRVFVRLPIISFVGEHMILDGIPQVAIGDNSYNIFLSNSEDDMIFVNETILPFLENECRLRVCVPERDFNPGVALFSTYHRSIKQSEKVIIVLSESYLTDLNCAHLLLEHIIVPLVNDKESKPKQVLIIQIDNAIEVPDILKYNSRFKSFLWKADSQLEDSLYVIKDWLFSEKSVQCVIA
ncbi:Toll-like receptor 8 [Mactra antiquata]